MALGKSIDEILAGLEEVNDRIQPWQRDLMKIVFDPDVAPGQLCVMMPPQHGVADALTRESLDRFTEACKNRSMTAAVPMFTNLDLLPTITETGLDGDPTCWFIVYVTGTGWCKIDAADVADIT